MVATTIQVENPSEQMKPLSPANPENGLLDTASGQRRPSHNRGSGRYKWNAGQCRLKLGKKAIIIIIIITIISSSLLISGIYNVVQHRCILQLQATVKQLQATVEQLQATVEQLQTTSTSKPCPQGWTLNERTCYSFSGNESTWNSANTTCSSSGGSLCVMGSPQEKAFINEKKHPTEYWMGLRRRSIGEPWKQPDGSDFDNWFDIKGGGLCASLNDGVVSSTSCDSLRRWICCKHLQAV